MRVKEEGIEGEENCVSECLSEREGREGGRRRKMIYEKKKQVLSFVKNKKIFY